jgi:hypothetical protein
MIKKVDPKELTQLAKYLTDVYGGDQTKVAEQLDTIIYLLHHLDDQFEREDIQSYVNTLWCLSNCFRGKESLPF